MDMYRGLLRVGAVTVTLVLAATAAAAAQTPTQTPPGVRGPGAPNAGPSASVNDQDIQAFAVAANEVRQLKQKWAPKVQAAAQQGPDAQQQAENQAMAEMTGAVQKNGLTVERYNQIAEMSQTDPDVQRKVQKHVKPTQ